MKTPEHYRITAIRLVEFHNLGTTTVEIPDGGHLFLLGDNGSGKTTLLDAIHLVLTAGREMEFNAAARVAGAKDSGGRTAQGIVLRYNAVTGRTYRESGITYAALELRSNQDRVLSLVVGLAAEGMEVAIDRWGGIASAPVAQLPLLIEEDGRLRAATQTEFKHGLAALTGGRAFAHINEYADAVGARLFGSADTYADVCKLLRTGKAYREIAARAANYDALFRQLLEDPSRETFEPLLKGLREIDESKARLEQIDERAKYLEELRRDRHSLDASRLRAEIISWAALESRRAADAAEAERQAAAIAAGEAELKTLDGDGAAAHAETVRARERLAELRSKDASGLINQEKRVAAHLVEAERLAASAAAIAHEAAAAAESTRASAASAAQATAAIAEKGVAELQKAAAAAGAFPLGALTDAVGALGIDPLGAAGADAAIAFAVAELERRREGVNEEIFEARNLVDAADRETAAARAALEELNARGETLPTLDGFAAARAEIRAAMLSANAVYELLEPAPGCDNRHLALLERFLGEEFLATFLASADQADSVRGKALKAGALLTVAERGGIAADVAALVPWLGKYISFEESDVDAVKLAALQLAASGAPTEREFLDREIWSFRERQGVFAAARPRLLGRKAREAEHARLVREAEARLAAAEKDLKSFRRQLLNREETLAAIKALAARIESVGAALRQSVERCRLAEERRRAAAELAGREHAAAEARRREAEASREELDDLRLRMRAEGIDDSLERKIGELEKKITALEREEGLVQQRVGGVRDRLAALRASRAAREKSAAAAAAEAARVAAGFAARVPAGMAADAFARETCPEAFAAGADFAALRETAVADAKVAENRIAAKIRDRRGEAFAFEFDAAANRIADRRGTPLDDVITEETRRLEELRGVIDRKSREVFERIFMGEVMRRLHLDLLRINDLVARIRGKLAGRRFGSNRYDFAVSPVPEFEGFVNLVKKGYMLDSGDGKDELREYLELHRDAIMNAELDAIPDMFDYRKWFRFQLKVLVENEEGRVIDRKVKSLGSGGEQAVPNYLLILTVAEFLYHGGEGADPPKTAPLLFDEAFYGIDAERRDQLLAFAESLELQLFVSSPDQDGVKREIRNSVSLIVVKDENLDVHLSPVVWKNAPQQESLLGGGGESAPGMTILEETK